MMEEAAAAGLRWMRLQGYRAGKPEEGYMPSLPGKHYINTCANQEYAATKVCRRRQSVSGFLLSPRILVEVIEATLLHFQSIKT